MQIPDIWSLLTGIASFVSLFLSVGNKFASWRKYTLPGAAALGGFAFGRISPSLSSGTSQLFKDPSSTGIILLIFLIFAVITFVAYLLIRQKQDMLAYCLVLLGMFSVPSTIIPLYSKAVDPVLAGDYVKLAQLKVTAEEYEQAIKYLELARDRADSEELKDTLKSQIITLEKKAVEITVNQLLK